MHSRAWLAIVAFFACIIVGVFAVPALVASDDARVIVGFLWFFGSIFVAERVVSGRF